MSLLLGVENITFTGSAVGQNLTVLGDLTVLGSQFIANSETFQVLDNAIFLNSDFSGSPTENCGLEVERGTSPDAQILWDESTDVWKVGTVGNLSQLMRLSDLNTTISTQSAPGNIMLYGGTAAPTGWLLCDGSTVSQTTYAALFAVIGTSYNTGGEAGGTFRLPDLRQRFPIGKSTGVIATTLGERGGSIDHSHSMLSHTHTVAHTHGFPAHSHGMDHSHTVPAHSHGPGNLAISSAGVHSHKIDHNESQKEALGWGGTLGTGSFIGQPFRMDYSYAYGWTTITTDTHTHSSSDFTGVTGDTINLTWLDGDTANASKLMSEAGYGTVTSSDSYSSNGASIANSDGPSTSNTTSNNPPYLVVNYIIKF